MNEVEIKKGWYYSLGSRFKWEGSMKGIGIAKKFLTGEGDLKITVKGKNGDDVFVIDKTTAVEFVRKHQCFEILNGVNIGYFPASFLEANNKA